MPEGFGSGSLLVMHITEQTDSRLVLSGVPGRRIWMIFLTVLGLVLTGAVCFFSVALFNEFDGLGLPHIALAFGLLIAQGLFWTGAVTLAVGRLTLILDKTEGRGEYRVKSPILEAGRPCKFKLDDVDSLTVETTRERRPGREGHANHDATVHRARLRLKKPRRVIVLDETENNRLERVEGVAQPVAEFLGKTVKRIQHGKA